VPRSHQPLRVDRCTVGIPGDVELAESALTEALAQQHLRIIGPSRDAQLIREAAERPGVDRPHLDRDLRGLRRGRRQGRTQPEEALRVPELLTGEAGGVAKTHRLEMAHHADHESAERYPADFGCGSAGRTPRDAGEPFAVRRRLIPRTTATG